MIMGARFADRIGRGLRGAPRDALVTGVTSPEIRGRAFGRRQSIDTLGAFLGPLIAIAAMSAFASGVLARGEPGGHRGAALAGGGRGCQTPGG